MCHVLVNCNYVDAVRKHGFQYRLQLIFVHREIAGDDGLVIRSREGGPGVDTHFLAYGYAMHGGMTADHHLEHAGVRMAIHAEYLFQRGRRDGIFACEMSWKIGLGDRFSVVYFCHLIEHALLASGELIGLACSLDVHEVNLWLVEKEMVMQPRYRETGFEGDAHHRVDLVFTYHRVTHQYHISIGCRREGSQ